MGKRPPLVVPREQYQPGSHSEQLRCRKNNFIDGHKWCPGALHLRCPTTPERWDGVAAHQDPPGLPEELPRTAFLAPPILRSGAEGPTGCTAEDLVADASEGPQGAQTPPVNPGGWQGFQWELGGWTRAGGRYPPRADPGGWRGATLRSRYWELDNEARLSEEDAAAARQSCKKSRLPCIGHAGWEPARSTVE